MYPRLCLLLSIGLLIPASASAQGIDDNQIEGVRFDIHGNLDRWGMFGAGARIEFAIVPDGFIRGDVHDEFALSFGADLLFVPTYIGWNYYDKGGMYIVPIAAAQWNFYLGDSWSIFPELGVAVHVEFAREDWKDSHDRYYPWVRAEPDIGFGARYHFSEGAALLMRISTPGGLQLGLVF